MDDPSAVVAEAELSGAPPGRTTRLILDLGHATDEAAALARALAGGVLAQIEAMLTDSATDPPGELRGALVTLVGVLAEQTADQASVIALNTPLACA